MAAIIAAAAAGAADNAVKAISSAVASIFGGETATDRRRVDRAADLLTQAISGSDAAVLQLCYEAFTRRTGLPGDTRTPVDNKYSPDDVRRLAVKALKEYVRVRGGLPPSCAQYVNKLNTAVIAPEPITPVDAVLDVVREGVSQGVSQGAERAAVASVRDGYTKYRPVLMVGAVVVAGWLAFRAFRSARTN